MTAPLQGKVALVTGAGRGLGREIALRLAKDGADIIVHYSNSAAGAEETVADVQAMGRTATIHQADLVKRDEIATMFEAIDKNAGRIDIVVNNSGVGADTKLDKLKAEDVDWVVGINMLAPLFITSEASKRLSDGGRIINLGSSAGEFPGAGAGVYAATKCALKSFTTSWAKELGARNITVNMVIPGATSPGMIDNAQQYLSFYQSASPFGRIGRAEEIAALVAFLASPEASWVTGAHILANGAANA